MVIKQYTEEIKKTLREEIRQIVLKNKQYSSENMVLKQFGTENDKWCIEHFTKLTQSVDYELYETLDEAVYDMSELMLRNKG